MLFSTKTAVAAVMAAAGLFTEGARAAAIVDGRGLEAVHVESTVNGTLTWYGDGASSKARNEDSAFSARDAGCGTNSIKCSGSHAYSGGLCQQLLASLNNGANAPVAGSPRSVCLGQSSDSGQCCISWSKATIYGLRQKDLLPSSQRVLNEWRYSSSSSGQEWNVLLGGTCLSQCLSNGPTGASEGGKEWDGGVLSD